MLSPVLKLLRSLHTGLQYLCVTTLLHLAENREDNRYVHVYLHAEVVHDYMYIILYKFS